MIDINENTNDCIAGNDFNDYDNVIIHENKYNDDGGGDDDEINLHLINLNSVMRECDS